MNDKSVVKLDSLDDVKPLHGDILVETFDRNKTMQFGDLELHTPVQGHDFANKDKTATSNIIQHSEREGKVLAVSDNLKERGFDFTTTIAVAPGDWVRFSAHAFQNSQHLTFEGRKLTLIDYRHLYMRGDEMLNGYMLAERAERPEESEVIASPLKGYFPNIFRVEKRAAPVEYKDAIYCDTEDVVEGSLVLTRFDNYPILEEKGHKRYSDKDLYVFQMKEVFARVEL